MIRAARLPKDFADWPALLGLILRAFEGMNGRIDPPSSALRLTPQSLADKAAEEIVFVTPGLSGCLFCKPQRDALYLGKLAVRPELHGKGYGRALLCAAEDEARRLDLPCLRLETRVELTDNHAAFARLGFIETARTAHTGFERPTSITMEKRPRRD